MPQIRIAVVNQSGGVGKTTVSTTLACLLAQRNYSVGLIDFEPQASLSVFTGSHRLVTHEESVAKAMTPDFDGSWPLLPVWEDHGLRVDLCSGSSPLNNVANLLYRDFAWPHVIRHALATYPMEHDVLIFDTGAQPEPFTLIASVAATHLLVPLEPDIKAIDGFGKLYNWFVGAVRRLGIFPPPEFLGVLPVKYFPQRLSMHRDMLPVIQDKLPKAYDVRVFDPIRFSGEFYNTIDQGIPIPLYRPKHPVVGEYQKVVDVIVPLINRTETQEEIGVA